MCLRLRHCQVNAEGEGKARLRTLLSSLISKHNHRALIHLKQHTVFFQPLSRELAQMQDLEALLAQEMEPQERELKEVGASKEPPTPPSIR